MLETLQRQQMLDSKFSVEPPYPSHARIKSFIPEFKGAYTAGLTRYQRVT